jgi:hypothetical protein
MFAAFRIMVIGGRFAERSFYPQIGKRFNGFSWPNKDLAKAGSG